MKFSYKKYFKEFKPKTNKQVLERFIFAVCSVHTSWERNVIGYNQLKDKNIPDLRSLKPAIIKTGMGMHNVRAKAIKNLLIIYKNNPNQLRKRRIETWQKYATRIEKECFGLGFAKARFAIELVYPVTAKVCCIDTHIAQKYGYNPNKLNKTKYNKIEQQFLKEAREQKISPIEYRWKYWDTLQGYKDCRYWSRCLE